VQSLRNIEKKDKDTKERKQRERERVLTWGGGRWRGERKSIS